MLKTLVINIPKILRAYVSEYSYTIWSVEISTFFLAGHLILFYHYDNWQIIKHILLCWSNFLVVGTHCYSCRRLKFISQNSFNADYSTLFFTLAPEDLMPSSCLYKYCLQVVHSRHEENTRTHSLKHARAHTHTKF